MIKFGRITSPIGNIIEEIKKTRKMGFDYIEICIETPTDNNLLMKNKVKIKKHLKNFSYNPIGHTSWWYDLSSPYEVVRKSWIKQAKNDITTAHALGIELLNFHFMVLSNLLLKYEKPRQVILKNYIQSLKLLSDFAESKGVAIMLENGEEKFEHYRYVLDRVPEVKVHFDVGHAFISGKIKTIRKFTSYFEERIAHIHIHDNHGEKDEHLALGKGKINWKQVVSLLKKVDYNKTITFEVFRSNSDLLKSMDYFKKLWYSA